MAQQNPRRQSTLVPFPRVDSSLEHIRDRYPSAISVPGSTGRVSLYRVTALELHDLIYGSGTVLNFPGNARAAVEKLYERDAVYENPLLTATSGDVIKDIHSLMHQFTAVSVPTPLMVLNKVFGRLDDKNDHWLNIAKVWSEIGEVCESDVYEEHRRIVIEHTVHMLILPDLFTSNTITTRAQDTPRPHMTSSASTFSFNDTLPGGGGSDWRTIGRQLSLPVHTSLSFNDSGRITHHRDIWDIKDVIALVPGVNIAQWVASRVVARSLATAFNVCAWAVRPSPRLNDLEAQHDHAGRGEGSDVSVRMTGSAGNALGLYLSERKQQQQRSRAPDTDPA